MKFRTTQEKAPGETVLGAGSSLEELLHDESISKLFTDEVFDLSYREVGAYPRVPLSIPEFKKKLEDVKQGKWIDPEDPEEDGLYYFVLLDKTKVPCILVPERYRSSPYCIYYPAPYQKGLEHKLAIGKTEISIQHLLYYTPMPLDSMDSAQFQKLQQACPLKEGLLDLKFPPEGIIVWVCETQKKFYFLAEYRDLVAAAIEDGREPAFFAL